MRFKELILARPIFYRLVSSNVDRAKLRAITRWGDDFSGLKILDLGCGIGNSVRLFRKSDYTGIDINLRYLKIAARRYPGLNFVAGDVNRLQWGGGFDIILIGNPEKVRRRPQSPGESHYPGTAASREKRMVLPLDKETRSRRLFPDLEGLGNTAGTSRLGFRRCIFLHSPDIRLHGL